jgi:mannose-6-phosphate isomerase-like protein (cupin superfamily)
MEVKESSSISSSTAAVSVGPGEGRAVRMAGLQLTRKVTAEQTGGAYSLFEVTVGPGRDDGPHVQHREDECFYVLEGRFGFVVEGEEVEAGPGSLVYVPKGTLHAFQNTGPSTGRMLVSQTPGGLYEGLIEEVGEPATDEATIPATDNLPEAERLAAAGAKHGLEMVPSLV